ncbi:MAG TPA: NUDIX domain-containing protein [Acidobacteriota bacterium]
MRIQVSVVLLERNGKFLVLRRPAGGHLSGLWEFPGGKKRREEAWARCARRELLEETGLAAADLEEIGTMVYPYADRTVEIRFFYTAHAEGALAADQEHAWLLPSEMNPQEFPEANGEIIRRLKKVESLKISIPSGPRP